MASLSYIRRYIDENSIILPPNTLITEKDMLKFSQYVGDIIDYSHRLNALNVEQDVTLNVIDLDDTFFSRVPQLELPLFRDNRGMDGNRIIDEYLGRDMFIDLFFDENLLNTHFKGILSNSDKKHPSLIVTAGDTDLQKRKLDKLKLSGKVPTGIVPESRDKLKYIIHYIISVLGYIPGKIIIYDDKVQSYKDSLPSASKILRSEIVLNEVFLRSDDLLRISHMHQMRYIPPRLRAQ